MREAAIGLFGASGYAGVELTRILGHHPAARLAFVAGDRWAGRRVEDAIGPCGAAGGLRYVDAKEGEARAADCAIVLCATPVEASSALVPKLRARGVHVVDLSAAFRFENGAIYGLTERARAAVASAGIVANPGCYPTAAALALGPLLRDGWIGREGIVIDAMSGVSGRGRRATEEDSFVELANDARAYKVLAHAHATEIARSLAVDAGAEVELVFTPHLIPVARGILCTSYAYAARPVTGRELLEALRDAYRDEPFVRVLDSPDEVSLARVVGTNDCAIGVACVGRRVVVVSAIDNLVKGAAGQAVQNVNAMLGLDERTGLDFLRRAHP